MNPPVTAPLIIIGSGLAGVNLAKNWRKYDQTTPLLLVTQDDGCFYSKPMLSTALGKEASPEDLIQATPEKLRETLNCDVLANTAATQINAPARSITISSGQEISYHKLVLAVGASPIQPALTGDAALDILTVNNRVDYQRFYDHLSHAKNIAIIGGGLIGCELANDLSHTDLNVTLLNASSSLLSALVPSAAAQKLVDQLRASNITVRLNTKVVKADHTSPHVALTLSDGTTLSADLVVAATGLAPNTYLAKAAGLKTSRGIETNEYLETSNPHIFALGDCATVCGTTLLYVMPLMNSAKALAKTLAGERTAVHYPAMPISIKTTRWPMTVLPPLKGTTQEWRLIHSTPEGEEWHCLSKNHIVGFALAGDQRKKKNALASLCPAIPL